MFAFVFLFCSPFWRMNMWRVTGMGKGMEMEMSMGMATSRRAYYQATMPSWTRTAVALVCISAKSNNYY